MTVEQTLILYSRPGCHLCDLAAAMLVRLGADWREENIESDAGLEERYGLEIPVVYCERTKKKLSYPFGEEQLSRFLEEINKT